MGPVLRIKLHFIIGNVDYVYLGINEDTEKNYLKSNHNLIFL